MDEAVNDEEIIITVAGPITAKQRARKRADGRFYTPLPTNAYEKLIQMEAVVAMMGRVRLNGAVRCDIRAEFAPPKSLSRKERNALLGTYRTKKPDADNIAKLMDGLNGIVWEDDAQVCVVHVTKIYGEQNRLTFTVRAQEERHAGSGGDSLWSVL